MTRKPSTADLVLVREGKCRDWPKGRSSVRKLGQRAQGLGTFQENVNTGHNAKQARTPQSAEEHP